MEARFRSRFCSWCGVALESRQVEGRARSVCPGCDRVAYDNPVPAAAVVVRRTGQVLLGRRNIDPYLGSWTLPAGYQEVDESIQATAVREVREETGLIVRLTGLLDALSTQDDPRKPSLLIVFEGEEVEGELEPGSDCDEVAFFDLDGLPRDIGFRNHRIVLERIRSGEEREW